jgi:two-component sensor histidine kinase
MHSSAEKAWSNVPLEEKIAEELRPYMARDRTNIRIQGPTVLLDPRGALALGMAIPELPTNAVKYGAFSVADRDVTVNWTVEQANLNFPSGHG